MAPPLKLSDAEWTVMQAVWAHSPASGRDVLERVETETGWAYTTVKSLLARLVEKGALAERKRANTSFYEPRVTRDEARRSALHSLVEKAFDGTFGSLVQHLLVEEKLGRKEREKLARMLADVEREEKRK
jgi:BlaI family transcriptional regulator, penicillinase repressor